MDNFNFIFNELNPKIKNNQFIIDSDKIINIKEHSDIVIDYNVLFTGIFNIKTFEDLDKLFEDSNYEFNLKSYIFFNFLKYNQKHIKKNLPIITNIIYKFFNIKNKEISYIFKSLKTKKDIINFIKNNYL